MQTDIDKESLLYPRAIWHIFIFRLYSLLLFFSLAVILSGCSTSSLLPNQKEIVVTPWNSYDETTEAYDRIIPYKTTKNDLQEIGFTPQVTSNIKILNYLDIMDRFMPNQSITKKDLADGLQDCLDEEEQCTAYEITIRKFDSQRHGNLFLDLFNFRRKTTVSGWQFNALIIMKDSLVVYKLSSGTPMTDELHDSKNPLGPLQNSDRLIWTVAQ